VGEAEAQLAVARLKVRELEEEKEEQQQRQQQQQQQQPQQQQQQEHQQQPQQQYSPFLPPTVVEETEGEAETARLKEINVALRREVERGKVSIGWEARREGVRDEGGKG